MNQAILSVADQNDESLILQSAKTYLPMIGPTTLALIAVDSRTHRAYWPRQNVGGTPVLRISADSEKQT